MWKRSRRPPDLTVLRPEASDPLAEVAAQVRAGNAAATRTLLAALMPALLRVARQVLGRHHPEINDVVQEAAFGVLSGLGRFRGESTIMHFACRAGVLSAMNVRRRELSQARKAEILRELEMARGVGPGGVGPEDALIEQRAAAAVRELLGKLPEAQAEVLGLHYVVGLTAAEIAALTGAPLETVRSRLRLGRQALRQYLSNDEPAAELAGVRDGHAR
jgi:RNA polymerase sigma factor (sigma-70 family)